MTAPFVARTKTDRQKLIDNRPTATMAATAVRLACGCLTENQPQLSNPTRYWCGIHLAWSPKR